MSMFYVYVITYPCPNPHAGLDDPVYKEAPVCSIIMVGQRKSATAVTFFRFPSVFRQPTQQT